MAYCAQADIEKLIPELELAELTTESGSTPDSDVVTEAIAKADAIIDAYCGKQYSVPFDSVPEMVESLSIDIAVYRLYLRRRVVPDPARQRYEDAMAFLKDVSRGAVVIGTTDSPPDTASGSNEVQLDYQDRVFTRTGMNDL